MQSFRRERRASERTSERARVAITGGILGTPGLMPNNPHAADTSCLCTKTTPLSLGPTPSPVGGRRCRLKFQPDAAPKKRLPLSISLSLSRTFCVQPLFFSSLFSLCLSMRSLSLSRNSRHVPSIHRELLLLAVVADQSTAKRIINARANQSGWL